ncbi:MAG: LytTR family DNA-binding domain-containing protein [Thomasclavelia sp.]
MISIFLNTVSDTGIIKAMLSNFFNYQRIAAKIETLADKKQYHQYYDLYFIEVTKIEDLKTVEAIDRNFKSLIYVIGKKDYQLIDKLICLKIDLFLDKDNLIDDFKRKEKIIINQINDSFKTYQIIQGTIKIILRISQIIYIESFNHHIVIHCKSGELIERKQLSKFIKDINSDSFIQVHKSFVVNKEHIKMVEKKQLVLTDEKIIPIGKKYSNIEISI